MDPDLAQVRGFIAVAERRHFGRAAATLFVTQQALSKRIQRLEQTIGEPLFRTRQARCGAERGRGSIPAVRPRADHCRRRSSSGPLELAAAAHRRMGQVHAPLRLVSRLTREYPALLVEVSMRRSLRAAAGALERGEIDAAFGHVHDLARPWRARLRSRPVYLARGAIGLSTAHRLAGAAVIQVDELRRERLWMPATATSPEVMGFYRQFAEHFGMVLDTGGHKLGLDHMLHMLGSDPTACMLIDSDWPVPADVEVRMARLRPQPCFPWSLVWRDGDRHPSLPQLLGFVEKTGDDEGWLAHHPDSDWIPEIDLPGIPSSPS